MFEIKFTENDFLNSSQKVRQMDELSSEIKKNLITLLFMCIGKSKPFTAKIVKIELLKYFNLKLYAEAIAEKILEEKELK